VSRHKRIVYAVVCIVLFTSIQQLWADSKAFNLTDIGSKVTRIEYRLEEDEWREVDLDHPQILVQPTSDETTLQLRQYRGSDTPGNTFIYRYDVDKDTWIYFDVLSIQEQLPVEGKMDTPVEKGMDVAISPYGTMAFTDNALKVSYSLTYGAGVELSLSFPFNRSILFTVDGEAQWAKSNNIWVDSFFILGLDVGVGYTINLSEVFQLTPALLYGMRFHYGIDSILDDANFMEQVITANLKVGYQFDPAIDAFIAPQAQFMFDSTRHGFLYGLRGGVQVVL